MIAAGHHHTVVCTDTNVVLSWGDNARGQLGSSNREVRSIPRLSFKRNICYLTTKGDHNLALTESGEVLAWGANDFGQLGDGTTYARLEPVTILQDVRVRSVSAGWYHSLALTEDGEILAWGVNKLGQIGDGTTVTRKLPVSVLASGVLGDVSAIAAGWRHNLALTEQGDVLAWGANDSGQFGNGSLDDSLVPIKVLDNRLRISALAAGYAHSIALTKPHEVLTWGANESGQLGDGSLSDRAVPAKIASLVSAMNGVAAGYAHCLALGVDGNVYSWGANDVGQVGGGSTKCIKTPEMVLEGCGVVGISAGWTHNIAYENESGKCWSWGENGKGQVGDGNIGEHRFTPVRILKSMGIEMHPSFFSISLQQLSDLDFKACETLMNRYQSASTHTIVDEIICPLTKGTNAGYARLLNEGRLVRAHIFVSHAWDDSFKRFAEYVTSAFPDAQATHPPNGPSLWMSFAALWQGGEQRSAARPGLHPSQAPFAQVIGRVQTLMLVRDDQVDVFERIWCVWELFMAERFGFHKRDHGVQVIGTAQSAGRGVIDLEKCFSTEPEDKQWIMSAVSRDRLSVEVALAASKLKSMYCTTPII